MSKLELRFCQAHLSQRLKLSPGFGVVSRHGGTTWMGNVDVHLEAAFANTFEIVDCGGRQEEKIWKPATSRSALPSRCSTFDWPLGCQTVPLARRSIRPAVYGHGFGRTT